MGLRTAGAVLCGAAWLAARALLHLHPPGRVASPGWVEYALAAVAFVGAGVGAALVMLGHHVFDEIDVGERWRQHPTVGASTRHS